jgi:hypothetical protein
MRAARLIARPRRDGWFKSPAVSGEWNGAQVPGFIGLANAQTPVQIVQYIRVASGGEKNHI